ncbi:Rieske (2Fe-2S) protein [Aquimarina rhabdastrellae]
MKKLFYILFTVILITSCSTDDASDNNPFLPPASFNYEINLDLPQYNDLKFAGNHFVDRIEGHGIQGVILFHQGNNTYHAFELSDPNHTPNSCSDQAVSSGVATCRCDDGNSYSIVTGQQLTGEGGQPLRRYRVTREGNILFVSN